MIYAFTGKTGSGKTYKMVRTAYTHWLRGRDIYSNTVLVFKKSYLQSLLYRKQPGRIIYFEDIKEILEARDGVIIFDEAQVLFNAREWESLPSEFQYKLQQHRKHKLDLLCTTQNMGAIDITYRRLVQKWWHCRDVFALLWKRNPSWLSLHVIEEKDVDQLYNSVDDLMVETVKTRFFIIHKFSRVLYDTFYDIGFKRFKTIWLSYFEPKTGKFEKTWYIIPKNLSLKNVQTASSMLKSALNPLKYQRSSKS